MMPGFKKSEIPLKVRLSGSDCFHLVLDKHAQKHRAGDNVMRKVFLFDERLSKPDIESIFNQSPVIYWLCNIELMRGNLLTTPWWKYTDRGQTLSVTEHSHDVAGQLPHTLLTRDIPLNATYFVEVDLVHYPNGATAFVLSWNHIVMDGKGTQLLLDHLENVQRNLPYSAKSFFPAPEKEPSLFHYVRNLYKVKSFVEASSKAPIASVSQNQVKGSTSFSYFTIPFTKPETETIDANAKLSGAHFGANMFTLSCCAHAVHRLNTRRKKAGALWLPIPYNGRKRGAKGPIVTNSVATVFYRLPAEKLESVASTVEHLNQQMADQMKVDMPRSFEKLLNMMRYFPLWLYYFLINKEGKGNFASFLYTTTGENFNQVPTLFGKRVSQLNLIPASTYPPGLTFIFLRHQQLLNINISYSPEVLSDLEMNELETDLKGMLLGQG